MNFFLLILSLQANAAPVLIEQNGEQAIVDVQEGGDGVLKGFTILCDARKDKWCAPKEADLGAMSVVSKSIVVDSAKKAARAAERASAKAERDSLMAEVRAIENKGDDASDAEILRKFRIQMKLLK